MRLNTTADRPGSPGLVSLLLDSLSVLGIRTKINVLLLVLCLLPPLAMLLLLPNLSAGEMQNVLALYVAALVLLFYPLAWAVEELVILRQTRRINTYVDEVKAGRRTSSLQLPQEKGNEHDFLRLQRNIFWMVQGLKNRESRIQETLNKLQTAQRQVLESIDYASHIQRSFLPSEQDLARALGDYFLLWNPRDGVGGDAYWVKREEGHTYLAVFDCTGHGVPGAFLTLIVNSLFEQCVDRDCRNKPAALLERMNQGLQRALSRHGQRKVTDDGLEGAVCCLDHANGLMHYAGARGFLLLVHEDGVQEIKGDKSGVGFTSVPLDQEFTNHVVRLEEIRAAYLFTDGMTDQIGGPKGLPYGRGRLKAWVADHFHLPMPEQRRLLGKEFGNYKGRHTQRDDVTVLGFSTLGLPC